MSAVPPESSNSLTWVEHPGRALVTLAWPITISMVSFSTMTLASTAFVAHLGADQLAGVGLAGVIGFALVCFALGLLRGAKTLVSQALGADRRERIPALLGSAVALAAGFGVLGLVAGELVAPVLDRLTASPAAGHFATQYLAIRSLGTPLAISFAALREAKYGEGDMRTPMRASIAGNAVNIGLDTLLIIGLHWGVRGAAVAAICGNATELALLAIPMAAQLRAMKVTRAALRETWAQGVPNGLQFVMEVGAFLILTLLVARMSAVDAAAHQMVLHLVNVSFLPAHALAEAAAVLVGQAVGAARDDLVPRVARNAIAIGAGYSTACCAIYAVLGGRFAHALAGQDAVLGARATTLVHVSLIFLVADAANVIARGVLRGTSDVRYAAMVGILCSWVTTPPLAYLLGVVLGYGVVGGWLGLAVEIILGASLFWRRVLRGGWQPAAAAARRALAGTAV
jgi:MATE family multidrug resistance protein